MVSLISVCSMSVIFTGFNLKYNHLYYYHHYHHHFSNSFSLVYVDINFSILSFIYNKNISFFVVALLLLMPLPVFRISLRFFKGTKVGIFIQNIILNSVPYDLGVLR